MSFWEGFPHERDEYRRREYEALMQQLRATEAKEQRLLARLDTASMPRKQLQGTPQALREVQQTIQRLLAEGALWWSD